MNLQLANTEEFIEGQFTGNLGEVLIRYACCPCVQDFCHYGFAHKMKRQSSAAASTMYREIRETLQHCVQWFDHLPCQLCCI